MFEITMNGKTLYHPNATDCVVTNAVIHEALNDAGYMDITVPYLNPLYDEIEERKSKIIVYKDNEPIWYGLVRDVSVDFGINKSLYVVGEAAYLNDSAQPQKSYEDTKFKIFEALINSHNAQVEADKRFMVGTVGINANVRRKVITDWEYTLDAIRNHLCGDDEYFRIRHVGNNRYIDIMPLESYGKKSDQVIQFGENLLDYAENITGEELATVCIPLGAPLENEVIEGHSNYLTCANANGQNGKNYVELPTAINKLGRITKIVHFNVLTDPNALVTAAINYLQSAQYSKLSLILSAVDLSNLHSDIDNYSVGDYVRAICEPMGMDSWFPVREKETDLINIANNSITVGAEGTKSFTTQQIETIEDIQSILASNTRESFLYAALKNASNLINANGQNGHVSIRINAKGEPYEVVVMDAETLTQSTRAWRWNLNGFGHGTKKAGASEFTWETNVALTMDGEVVADKGSISGFIINKGKSLDGETTDFLKATTNSGSTELGSFTIGHKPKTGKSVILMQFRDAVKKLKKFVGMYDDYVYVGQTDLNDKNEKGTKIEPLQIITDGSVYAYGDMYIRKNNGWYSLYDGVSTAISTANTAGTSAQSAYNYADSVNKAQKDNYDNAIKHTNDMGDALNKRCDAILTYAQGVQQYAEGIQQLVNYLHGL